jgi:NADH-quinone oxidoreductase subunit M
MSILNLLILIPVITLIGILIAKNHKQVRVVSAIGMSIQLVISAVIILMYLAERKAGNVAEMIFTQDMLWFSYLNIHYAIGVDGISVAMIGLTSVVIFTGVFTSWEVEEQAKEFFFTLILLSTGVFGFFISLDLFTMFLFYEIAVIPMYLLIGLWGSGWICFITGRLAWYLL